MADLLLLTVVGVLAVEGAVADVLLAVFDAATAIRVVVFVLHVYTIWLTLVVGASCTVRPHVVTGEVLRVRYGVFLDLTVPRSLITAVRLAHRYDEPRAVGVEGDRLAVAVGSRTNVVVELAEPVTVVRPLGVPRRGRPRSGSSPRSRAAPSPRSAQERRDLTRKSKIVRT